MALTSTTKAILASVPARRVKSLISMSAPMCRADVAEDAGPILAGLLIEIATVLADREGVDADAVTIGPVDFGPCDE